MNAEIQQWRSCPPRLEQARKLRRVAWWFSGFVLLVVLSMRAVRIPLPEGWSTASLPGFHAGLNTAVSLLLIVSLACIKQGKVRLHRATMVTAMGISALFLISYIIYHLTSFPIRHGGQGMVRTIYLVLLASHILFAAISLPPIFFTFIAGWTNDFSKHRRLARWVYPLWLYVAMSGVICYWMLKPYM